MSEVDPKKNLEKARPSARPESMRPASMPPPSGVATSIEEAIASHASTQTLPAQPQKPTQTQPPPPQETKPLRDIVVRYFGKTDVGLVREHNEDNFLVADLTLAIPGLPNDEVCETHVGGRGFVFAVCDGMGGAAAGEVASGMAVDTIYEVLMKGTVPPDRDTFARRLVDAVEEAGRRIFASAKADKSRRGMGTTSTVVGLIDHVLFVAQVGDSRAYVLRNGELNQITKDQSLVNQLIEAGQLSEEEAELFEHSNIILQALGTTEEVVVDLTFLELRRGDRFVICSDGLSGLVPDDTIREVLATAANLPEAATRLIEFANRGGGHDNITVVLMEFDGSDLSDSPARANYQQYPLPPVGGEDIPPSKTKRSRRKSLHDMATENSENTPGLSEALRKRRRKARRGTNAWTYGLLAAAGIGIGAGAMVLTRKNPVVPVEEHSSETLAAETSPHENTTAQAELRNSNTQSVDIRVQTDLDHGELFVDDEYRGDLHSAEVLLIHLPQGGYRFEARKAGNLVSSQFVTVEGTEPMDVMLQMPEGAMRPEPSSDGGRAQKGARDGKRAKNEAAARNAARKAAAETSGEKATTTSPSSGEPSTSPSSDEETELPPNPFE